MTSDATPSATPAAPAPAAGPASAEAPAAASQTAPPPEGKLRSRVMKASIWSISTVPVSMVMQTARNVVMTWLLFPEAFGLMLLVNTFMSGLQMISDVGIAVSIVQHKDGEDESFLQTAWTLQIVRGAALWLVCCLLAWPVSWFWEQPELLWLVPAAGFSMVLMAMRSTSINTHRRNLKLGPIAVFGFGTDILQFAILVVCALVTKTVWALVLGSLIGNAAIALASHVLLPGVRHRLRWDPKVASTLMHAGKWIFVGSLLTFLARKGDGLVLGKLISMEALGVYGIALTLAMFPRETMSGLSADVLFPAVSEKLRTDAGSLDLAVERARSILLRVALLGCSGIALGAPVFFTLFYDDRYVTAGPMAQFLVVPAWFGVLHVTSGYTLLAVGDNRALTFVNGVSFVLTWAFSYLGYKLFGFGTHGFIVGMGVGLLFGELVMQRALGRHGVHLARQDLRFTLAAAAVSLGGVGATTLAQRALPGTAPWIVAIVVGAVWLGPFGIWLGRRVVREVLKR